MHNTIENLDLLINTLVKTGERCHRLASDIDEIRDIADDIIKAKAEIINLEVNTSKDDDQYFIDYCKRLLERKEKEMAILLKRVADHNASLGIIKAHGVSLPSELPKIDTDIQI
jgi:hypothetical protein